MTIKPGDTYKDSSGVLLPLGKRFRPRVQKFFTKPSRTQQNFRDECDINMIVSRYKKTGLLTHVKYSSGTFEDLTLLPDYKEAMNVIAIGTEAFASVPAKLRARFNNDVGEFLQFVHDPLNEDELVKLGLAKARVVVPPVVPAVRENPASPGSDKGPAKPPKEA